MSRSPQQGTITHQRVNKHTSAPQRKRPYCDDPARSLEFWRENERVCTANVCVFVFLRCFFLFRFQVNIRLVQR